MFIIILLLSSSLFSLTIFGKTIPIHNINEDSLLQLLNNNLIAENKPIKLHLGCGENHFFDYINIDYPSSEHTVQMQSGADLFADIINLEFPPQSIDEIRSHHFFEHFDRQTALGLLCKWHSWLKIGGKLVIETPDFQESIRSMLNNNITYSQKQGILRHIFGSHEAYWAMHYDGWYKEKFEKILTQLFFESIACESTKYLYINNIIIEATKKKQIPLHLLAREAKMILRDSMIIAVESEEKMWEAWCKKLDDALFLNHKYY